MVDKSTARRHAEAIGDEVTLRRTDPALFDLDLAKRTLTCNLVEVKCYAQNLGRTGTAMSELVEPTQVRHSGGSMARSS